jgi:hypothetical protein
MSAPERVRLAPNGGLPTGNWPKSELVEYIRADVAKAQREKSAKLALKSAASHVFELAQRAVTLSAEEHAFQISGEIEELADDLDYVAVIAAFAANERGKE